MTAINLQKKTGSPFCFLVFSLLLLCPLALHLGDWSDKPLDLVPSDLLLIVYLLLALVYGLLRMRPSITLLNDPVAWIAYCIMGYCFVEALIQTSINQDLMALISMLRFIKPFLFIGFGWYWAKTYGYQSLVWFPYAASIILIIMMGSDIIFGSFPSGCGTEGRWGGCLAHSEVYGFPNSSSSYLVILFTIILSGYYLKLSGRFFFLITSCIATLLALLSLSRATGVFVTWVMLVWTFTEIYYAWRYSSLSFSWLFFPIIFAGIVGFLLVADSSILNGINNKYAYALERVDISSGRFEIWASALDLIAEKPLFGYRFEPFSTYIPDYDTAHNQYLEWMYKIGILGFLLWLSFLLLTLCNYFKLLKMISFANRKAFIILGCGGFVGLLINGIFQPIFSYSMVSNLFMFAIGLMLYFVNNDVIN